MNDYEGTFDGNNHTISGMTIITAPDTDGEVGFIANLNSGTVKNLGMIDVNINITVNSIYQVGAIAGNIGSETEITNCYSSGSISVKSVANDSYPYVGGIVEYQAFDGTAITSCYSSAIMNISADLSSERSQAHAGGIIGFSQYADITSCHFTGSIFAEAYTAAYAGGIIGENDSAIKACYSTGSISAEATTRTYAGGIAGDSFSSGSITACHSTGNISGKNSNNTNVGGICGENRGVAIRQVQLQETPQVVSVGTTIVELSLLATDLSPQMLGNLILQKSELVMELVHLKMYAKWTEIP